MRPRMFLAWQDEARGQYASYHYAGLPSRRKHLFYEQVGRRFEYYIWDLLGQNWQNSPRMLQTHKVDGRDKVVIVRAHMQLCQDVLRSPFVHNSSIGGLFRGHQYRPR